MKIAICDDEKAFVESVSEHLAVYSEERSLELEVHSFTNGADLLESGEKFNIAILDVEMPGCNGIELGKKLREQNKHIVLMYITAHRKYLDEALNLNAARFFEKPVDIQRFYKGLTDAIERIDNTTIQFFLKDGKATQRVNASDIIYIEIYKRKSHIVTVDNDYYSSTHIDTVKDMLSSTVFASPHRSFIINLNYVTRYERDEVILDGRYRIAVARNRQTEFNRRFLSFAEGK